MALDALTTAKKDVVRNLIVQLLAKEHPLSLMNIHKRLEKNFGTRVSFQATRKAAKTLVEAAVLSRNSNKEYEISRKWIFDSKKIPRLSCRVLQDKGKFQGIQQVVQGAGLW